VSVNELLRGVVSLKSDEIKRPGLESRYDGPVRESSIRVAGRSIRLVQPVEPDRLLDAPEVIARNAVDDYMPYWAYLWPGALLLGEAVALVNVPAGTQTLEIGCGLGLSGLVAVSLGLKVRFTDQDRTPLRFIEASARANGFDPGSYSTALLDWRSPPDERYPLILGADVTYEKRLVPLVAGVIAAMLEPGGLALLSDPNRASAEGLADALKDLGLATEAVPVEGDFEGMGLVRGTIHRVWHPI
jgi:predicted nicotinamide N-methyase